MILTEERLRIDVMFRQLETSILTQEEKTKAWRMLVANLNQYNNEEIILKRTQKQIEAMNKKVVI
jgi:lipase chaperone LimK